MIKRPLNAKFSNAVRDGIKITTIRENPWPVGKPIMLYNWSDKPYRSKQIDVLAVEVLETTLIIITRDSRGDMIYCPVFPLSLPRQLWECEGFDSKDEMDSWFSAKMKPGQSVAKHLMRFRVL